MDGSSSRNARKADGNGGDSPSNAILASMLTNSSRDTYPLLSSRPVPACTSNAAKVCRHAVTALSASLSNRTCAASLVLGRVLETPNRAAYMFQAIVTCCRHSCGCGVVGAGGAPVFDLFVSSFSSLPPPPPPMFCVDADFFWRTHWGPQPQRQRVQSPATCAVALASVFFCGRGAPPPPPPRVTPAPSARRHIPNFTCTQDIVD